MVVRVRITGSSYAGPIMAWWYHDKIGQEFEVEQCPKFEKYWRTKDEVFEGHTAHILKTDCEIADDSTQHGVYEITKMINKGK
jgi:hypothetical protein